MNAQPRGECEFRVAHFVASQTTVASGDSVACTTHPVAGALMRADNQVRKTDRATTRLAWQMRTEMSANETRVRPERTSPFAGVTLYQWLVVTVASCGWLFDCMSQRLFTMARLSALQDLLGSNASAQAEIERYLTLATAAMMLGWAIGGILFGMLSDKWGRVKTMAVTLVCYTGFTGLSGLATGWVDFTLYRLLMGLGVGGMFGAATTLVAESVPGNFRAVALGSLQALSAVGNLLASAASRVIPPGATEVAFAGVTIRQPGWRVLFFVGVLPALLVIPIVSILREPEAWLLARQRQTQQPNRQLGSLSDLFWHARWRKSTLIGLGLGIAGMFGLWGVGFFSPELISTALKTAQLRAVDVLDPVALAEGLTNPITQQARHVAARLPSEARLRLSSVASHQAASAGSESSDLRQWLADELNRLIAGPSLFDPTVFADVPPTISGLAGQLALKQRAEDRLLLNRKLVELAFPGQIAPIQAYIDSVRSNAMMLFDVGCVLGMFAFTYVAARIGRRPAFAGAFIACLLVTIYTFISLKSAADAYLMLPMLGFCQLSVFAGYSIYFPELYPTRLRGTGVGFCYNAVRFVTVPLLIAMGHLGTAVGLRHAGAIMSCIYVLGLVTLIWAEETKGRQLPED